MTRRLLPLFLLTACLEENSLSGSMSEVFPLEVSKVEVYKNDALEDPMVTEEHITCFGWANTADIDDIEQIASGVRAGAFDPDDRAAV